MSSPLKRILVHEKVGAKPAEGPDHPDLVVLEDIVEESAGQNENELPAHESSAKEPADVPASEQAPTEEVSTADKQTISLPFEAVAGDWPAELRSALGDEINKESWFHLPIRLIEPGLRRGCVALRWRELADLANPPVSSRPLDSVADSIVEVPLDQLVSLYLLQSGLFGKDVPNQLPDDVPDLFHSGPPSTRSAGRRPSGSEPNSEPAELGVIPHTIEESPTGGTDTAEDSTRPHARNEIGDKTVRDAPRASHSPTAVLTLPLTVLLPCWPKPVRRELEGRSLEAYQVKFPVEQINARIRRGRAQFVWSEVLSWIVPALKDVATTLPGSLRIRVPLALLDEPYREWQRANPAADSAPPPVSGLQAVFGQGREPESPRAGTASGDSTERGRDASQAWPKWPGHRLGPEELVATLRTVPGVDWVFVTAKDGRIAAGSVPSPTVEETMKVLVPELRHRLVEFREALELGEARWLLLTGKERTAILGTVGEVCLIALTRFDGTPAIELFRFISEAPVTLD